MSRLQDLEQTHRSGSLAGNKKTKVPFVGVGGWILSFSPEESETSFPSDSRRQFLVSYLESGKWIATYGSQQLSPFQCFSGLSTFLLHARSSFFRILELPTDHRQSGVLSILSF
ncbi:Hypothetical protein NTJ_05339 [Nesidiocoris tenuis]|uniref:Rap-GAP domain-containing protein n=1 Tax=Nesidiocoris tenuis TaxID=355587 RepID=A0ABN7AJU2_9HEMI|nr:Hypothetical protein NTJ_05339 [Nesidiocoris tenuis]